jgi:hypothetical protein
MSHGKHVHVAKGAMHTMGAFSFLPFLGCHVQDLTGVSYQILPDQLSKEAERSIVC